MTVTVVVHERTPGAPAGFLSSNAGFFADIGEGAVAVVVVKDVLAEVGDEEIVESIVVVITDTDTLAPS
jgi:hypothetical protein